MDFDFNTTPFSDQYPKREISLTKEQERGAKSAITTLEQSGLTIEGLFHVFHDWRSRQTISSRRFFLSVSTLIAGSYWVGIDLSKGNLWGMPLSDANLNRFLVLAGILLTVSASIYLISRFIDARIRAAKISMTMEVIEPCRLAADTLERMASDLALSSTRELIDDFRAPAAVRYDEQEAYDAIRFYEDKMQGAHSVYKILDRVELAIFALVAVYVAHVIGTLLQT